MGEKSLVMAKAKAEQQRKLYNPLNHPKLAGTSVGKK